MERDMRIQLLLPITAMLALIASMGVARAEVFDFESAAVDSMPQGWSVAMTHDGGQPRWAVVSGDGGGKVLAQLSNDPTAQRFPLAIFTRDSIRNGTLSVRFKPISGRVDQAAGLVWRYQDENNYYIVRANALEDNVVLYKVESGNRVAISPLGREGEYGQRQEVPTNEWHTLGVEFSGPRFSVSFDGMKIYEVEDATFTEPGRVGLWTKADSVTQFDDFEVADDPVIEESK
jgi:Domain of Unknown Function (DUF1080)